MEITSHEHWNDSLYPRSAYRCSSCGLVHGTRPFNGAVNWQCPRELIGDANYHEPAKQTYIGFYCVVCKQLQEEVSNG